MKVLSIAAATMMLGAVATPDAASAQSIGFSFGTPGWGGHYSNSDYNDYYRYGGRGYGYRSAYYGGYGVPYGYYGGPRVYGYTQRAAWGYPRNFYRGDYVRDGAPGGERRVSTRVYSYERRRGDVDYVDRIDRRGPLDRPGLVRDGIPGGAISSRPRVAGYTRRVDSVIDRPIRSAGGCGTYFYWNGSACVDARLR
jgi:hypothetical protein